MLGQSNCRKTATLNTMKMHYSPCHNQPPLTSKTQCNAFVSIFVAKRTAHKKPGCRQVQIKSAQKETNQGPLISQQNWIESLKQYHSSHRELDGGVKGNVYLVGTGPGDPGLLTLKAFQLMQTADVILYDRLVSSDILKMIDGGALMVYVGKQKGFHTRTQEEIHEMLVEFATQGRTVLRLKGGDPFVFGRGGEEMEYLQQRGINVHVVPGITAAMGISSELGIPLTHRGIATSVRFLTGHTREGGQVAFDRTIASCGNDVDTTLVIYMGLNTLDNLVLNLKANGMDETTPVVAVERGTTPQQRAVFGRLSEIGQFVQEQSLASPTLIIVGQVVRLSRGWQQWIESGQGSRVFTHKQLVADEEDILDVISFVEQRYLQQQNNQLADFNQGLS
eukprot:TRINITY_DN2412_c0_g1_i10.p1 TRINITY_DN2412_c0_g1~~TRINITY_DN2412_c0_g1_i10.p1  ORF type:complete len:400 (+),score=45.88 TRINITY_DN2412_c0_g1_i10:26-1201(+)